RVDLVLDPGRDVIELARRAVPSALQLASQHEPGAESRADREEHEVVDPARDSLPALTEGCQIDVVLERHARAETGLELSPVRAAVEAADVRREPHDSRLRLDDAGDADDHLVDQARVEPRRSDERVEQPGNRVER